jgi:hypothetical protein
MEALHTSETLLDFYETTRRNIPEGSHIHVSSNVDTFSLPFISTYFSLVYCIIIRSLIAVVEFSSNYLSMTIDDDIFSLLVAQTPTMIWL